MAKRWDDWPSVPVGVLVRAWWDGDPDSAPAWDYLIKTSEAGAAIALTDADRFSPEGVPSTWYECFERVKLVRKKVYK